MHAAHVREAKLEQRVESLQEELVRMRAKATEDAVKMARAEQAVTAATARVLPWRASNDESGSS
jgi:hypothetical protein